MSKKDQDKLGGGLLAGALAGVGLDDTPENRNRYESLARDIEEQFNDLRESCTESDVLRILDEGKSVIRQMMLSPKPLESGLGKRADVLYRLLDDAHHGKFETPWATVSAVTAALDYMMSESDVVPDALPVVGLFDDLLVVLECSVLIRSDLERYAAASGINLREVGF